MYSKVITASLLGIEAELVIVESQIMQGLPYMQIIGLPDTMIQEAKERIKAAIVNTDLIYPKGKIIVNLSPADIKKSGSHFDLPMAVGILMANGVINKGEEIAVIGELSLEGKVCKVAGVLPMLMGLKKQGIRKVYIPYDNMTEGELVEDMEVYPIKNLKEIVQHINERIHINKLVCQKACLQSKALEEIHNVDFKDIKGQYNAKRGLMIAVAGKHGILMTGSPGTGKTMLSQRVTTIMPPMSYKEIVETTMIYSVAGLLNNDRPIINQRPFRSPHYKVTRGGLIGGGNTPKSGEITLAHNGVLFLDEVGEFDRNTLELLRTPLELKQISLFRKGRNYTFPCDFLLVAAQNPCKCGYYGDHNKKCTCTLSEIERYQRKLSGPIMDRIDLHIYLENVDFEKWNNTETEGSKEMLEVIQRVRAIKTKRNHSLGLGENEEMSEELLKEACKLTKAEFNFLEEIYYKFSLNLRTLSKVLKVARTIADIESSDEVTVSHISEAMQYRMKK